MGWTWACTPWARPSTPRPSTGWTGRSWSSKDKVLELLCGVIGPRREDRSPNLTFLQKLVFGSSQVAGLQFGLQPHWTAPQLAGKCNKKSPHASRPGGLTLSSSRPKLLRCGVPPTLGGTERLRRLHGHGAAVRGY